MKLSQLKDAMKTATENKIRYKPRRQKNEYFNKECQYAVGDKNTVYKQYH